MWIADMDFPSPEPVIDALRKRVEHGIFGYPDGLHNFCEELPGLGSLIVERMAERYQWQIQLQDIILLPGVIPGLHLACLASAQAEEESQASYTPSKSAAALVQTPVYPPIYQAANTTGMLHQEAALLRLDDGSYRMDWEALESAITLQTKLLIFCNPHNPVGKVYKRDELERLAEICLRKNLVICSDEIHCDLIYPGNHHIPIASLSSEVSDRTITLMSPSKTFNIPGLQCAFAIITNPVLRKKFTLAGKGLVSWVGIMGLTASKAAYAGGQGWLDQLLPYLKGNRDCLVEYVRQGLPGIAVGIPEGTYLAWLDCREMGLDGSAPEVNPANFFLERSRVALYDGSLFGGEGKGFARLNFACPRSRLMDALEKMRATLSE